MWTCSKCGATVESTETTCPKCGAPQFETMNANASSSNLSSTKTEKTPISSGVDDWAIAHIVFAIIFFIAAIGYWVAGADSYSKKAIYYDDALMYAGMGVASLFLSSLIKGFGFVIKAAKLYLMKNGENYPEDELVEKFQSGEYGWLDYVNLHSPEWQEEFTAFCKECNLTINKESAEQFVEWKGDQLENDNDDDNDN